jgi:hypothetical protein
MPIDELIEKFINEEARFITKLIDVQENEIDFSILENERHAFTKIKEYFRLVLIQLDSHIRERKGIESETSRELESASDYFARRNEYDELIPLVTLGPWIEKSMLQYLLEQVYRYFNLSPDADDPLINAIKNPAAMTADSLRKIYKKIVSIDAELTPRQYKTVVARSISDSATANLDYEHNNPISTTYSNNINKIIYLYWQLFDLVNRPEINEIEDSLVPSIPSKDLFSENSRPVVILPKLYSVFILIDDIFDEEYVPCFDQAIEEDAYNGGPHLLATCIQECIRFLSSRTLDKITDYRNREGSKQFEKNRSIHNLSILLFKKIVLLFEVIKENIITPVNRSLSKHHKSIYAIYYKDYKYSEWQEQSTQFNLRKYLINTFCKIASELISAKGDLSDELLVRYKKLLSLNDLYSQLLYGLSNNDYISYQVNLFTLLDAINQQLATLGVYGSTILSIRDSLLANKNKNNPLSIRVADLISHASQYFSNNSRYTNALIYLHLINLIEIYKEGNPPFTALFDLIYALNFMRSRIADNSRNIVFDTFKKCLENQSINPIIVQIQFAINKLSPTWFLFKQISDLLKRLLNILAKPTDHDIINHYTHGKTIEFTDNVTDYVCLLHYLFVINTYQSIAREKRAPKKGKLAYQQACHAFVRVINKKYPLFNFSFLIGVCNQVLLIESSPTIKSDFFHLWLDCLYCEKSLNSKFLSLELFKNTLSESNQRYNNPDIKKLISILNDIITIIKSPRPIEKKNTLKKVFHYFNASPFFKKNDVMSKMGSIILSMVHNIFDDNESEVISPIVDTINSSFSDDSWAMMFENAVNASTEDISSATIISQLSMVLTTLSKVRFSLNENPHYYAFEEFAIIKGLTRSLSLLLIRLQLDLQTPNVSSVLQDNAPPTRMTNAIFPLPEDLPCSGLYLTAMDQIYLLLEETTYLLIKVNTFLSNELGNVITNVLDKYKLYYQKICHNTITTLIANLTDIATDDSSQFNFQLSDLQQFELNLTYYLTEVIMPSYVVATTFGTNFIRALKYFPTQEYQTSFTLADIINLIFIHNNDWYVINFEAINGFINFLNLQSPRQESNEVVSIDEQATNGQESGEKEIISDTEKNVDLSPKSSTVTTPQFDVKGKYQFTLFPHESTSSKQSPTYLFKKRALLPSVTPSPSRAP